MSQLCSDMCMWHSPSCRTPTARPHESSRQTWLSAILYRLSVCDRVVITTRGTKQKHSSKACSRYLYFSSLSLLGIFVVLACMPIRKWLRIPSHSTDVIYLLESRFAYVELQACSLTILRLESFTLRTSHVLSISCLGRFSTDAWLDAVQSGDVWSCWPRSVREKPPLARRADPLALWSVHCLLLQYFSVFFFTLWSSTCWGSISLNSSKHPFSQLVSKSPLSSSLHFCISCQRTCWLMSIFYWKPGLAYLQVLPMPLRWWRGERPPPLHMHTYIHFC